MAALSRTQILVMVMILALVVLTLLYPINDEEYNLERDFAEGHTEF